MDIDFLEVELLAMVQHGPGVVSEKTAAFAGVLTLVVVVGVNDGLARDVFVLNGTAF